MGQVPTSWYEGEHLLARLRAADVPQSDPAWCVASGHLWGPYTPDRLPLPSFADISVAANGPEPIRAHRYCARCDAAQDYYSGAVRSALPTDPSQE